MAELTDPERVALLTSRLGLPEGALRQEVALEALRHGSFVHERRLAGEVMESNERLEFLGDAVLGLAVSMRCFERHPLAAEGDLTRCARASSRPSRWRRWRASWAWGSSCSWAAGRSAPADARSRACSPTRWRRWWLPG